MTSMYEQGLDKRSANYSSLSPVGFLKRSAGIFPDKIAVIDDIQLTYQQFYQRACAMASSLHELGIGVGDTVAVLAYNTRELLESHYSVPMLGAVLNALNTRLDAGTLRFILEHGEARVLMYDTEFEGLVRQVVAGLDTPPVLVAIARQAGPSDGLAGLHYEALVQSGDPFYRWRKPVDEWDAIALNYTSGTTGNPKGVVYHHRGAYLAALSNAMAFNMTASTVYLWTLPMFHCNGWAYTWAITAIGGTHVCLKRVDPDAILARIQQCNVTHMCGAPIVLNRVIHDFHASGTTLSTPVQFALGGAAPPNAVISKARQVGFQITHLYGLTESFGPSSLCVWQDSWDGLPLDDLAAKMARQGVGTLAIDDLAVVRTDDGTAVPADGATLGELVMRGNGLMKGYLKNQAATDSAFAQGWFHTGDLAVMHPDGYVEIKDRAKDIIISGGENISSKEIEDVLYQHPSVLEAAVVAMPDETWGETPCAFITLKEHAEPIGEDAVIAYCKANMASFKAPRKVLFGELPKTSTGKIQKNVLRDQLVPKAAGH